jgi:hypothetical protein
MIKRGAFVEHEAFPLPEAFLRRDMRQIIEHPAFEVEYFLKPLAQHVAAGLFAANAARAEHGDAPMFFRIEIFGHIGRKFTE